MKHFLDGKYIAFDTETTGLNPYDGDMPFAFSFCNENEDTAYFEFAVDPMTRTPILGTEELGFLGKMRALLEDPSIIKICHNAKFDVRMVEKAYNIRVAGPKWAFGPAGPVTAGGRFEETWIMAHSCNTQEINYKLKRLAAEYVDIPVDDETELKAAVKRLRRAATKLGWKIKYDIKIKPDGELRYVPVTEADYWIGKTLHDMHPNLASEDDAILCETYARLDAIRTMRLFQLFNAVIDEVGGRYTYENIELPLWPVLYHAEDRGIRIHTDRLNDEITAAKRRMNEAVKYVRGTAVKYGMVNVNLNSSKQMIELLHTHLKLPVNEVRRSEKTGEPCVDFNSLMEMGNNPVVRQLIRSRTNVKALGFFNLYDRIRLPDPIVPNISILHCEYRQVGAATGRLSCANPNLQQVTSAETGRGLDPIDARIVFGPRPGYVWLCVDYKGQEVRIYAWASQEPRMLETLTANKEIHDAVTNRAWGGEGNERGIHECMHVLGFDDSEISHNPRLADLWKSWGITDLSKISMPDRRKLTLKWFASFDWDIVEAQMSIGKKVTRNKAKMVFFNKIYGGGPGALCDLMRCSKGEAREFLNYYDEIYPGMKIYGRRLEGYARENGFIKSLWDRRISINPDFIYRCVNYVVQGSAADMLKRAKIRTARLLKKLAVDAQLVMTVHDELIFEISKNELTHKLVKLICREMEDTEGRIGIPMPVDPSVVTDSWKEKIKI